MRRRPPKKHATFPCFRSSPPATAAKQAFHLSAAPRRPPTRHTRPPPTLPRRRARAYECPPRQPLSLLTCLVLTAFDSCCVTRVDTRAQGRQQADSMERLAAIGLPHRQVGAAQARPAAGLVPVGPPGVQAPAGGHGAAGRGEDRQQLRGGRREEFEGPASTPPGSRQAARAHAARSPPGAARGAGRQTRRLRGWVHGGRERQRRRWPLKQSSNAGFKKRAALKA